MNGAPTSVKQRLVIAFTPGVLVLLAVLMLIIGVALTGGSYLESQETHEIALNGVRTTAEVIEAYETRQDLRTISIDEKIRFTTADGTQVEETITDCGDRKPEPPGSHVQVRYARTDPSAVQFAELACRKVSDATGFMQAGIAALLAGLLLLWSAWRARRRWAPIPV